MKVFLLLPFRKVLFLLLIAFKLRQSYKCLWRIIWFRNLWELYGTLNHSSFRKEQWKTISSKLTTVSLFKKFLSNIAKFKYHVEKKIKYYYYYIYVERQKAPQKSVFHRFSFSMCAHVHFTNCKNCREQLPVCSVPFHSHLLC